MKIRGGLTALVCVAFVTGCQSIGKGEGAAMKPTGRTGVVFDSLEQSGEQRKYAVYLPREYDGSKPWPLVVFLNGKGECGVDGQKQLAVGLMPAVMADAGKWPCVVLALQKPDAEKQWSEYDTYVMQAIAATQARYAIDGQRVYLTGLSQGGAGTWAIAAAHPAEFAAIAPVCGYGTPTPELGQALKGMPIWAFHGGKDDVVPPQRTQALVDAVRAAGGEPKLTIFPQANHNSWDQAYRTVDLGNWFLQHSRAR